MRSRFRLPLLVVLATVAVAHAQPQPVQTVLDTAIGGDIDQAFGLAYALTTGRHRSPRHHDRRRSGRRAGLDRVPIADAERVAEAFRQRGAEPQPKLGIDWQIHIAGIPRRSTTHPEAGEDERSWRGWRSSSRTRPAPTTILATGPLTKRSPASSKEHPDAAKTDRRGIVCVGSERNLGADVPAARAVLASNIPLTFVAPELAAKGGEAGRRRNARALRPPCAAQFPGAEPVTSCGTGDAPASPLRSPPPMCPLSSTPKKNDARLENRD